MGQGNSTHPVHSAGRTGNVCVIRRYLKNPAILNRRDGDEMTCLHWAAQLGHIDIVQELVAAGADLDAQDVNGWTPLMHACCRGHKMVVSAMLSAGAGIDIESHDGRTTLHRAATWKRLGPLDQLIEAGGDVTHKAGNKWTPLHCAAAAGDANACTILLEAGADPDAEDEHGLRPVDVIADISATESVTMILNQMRRRSPARSARPPAAFPVPLASPSYSGVGVRERGGVREGGLAGNRPYPTPTSLCASVLPSSRGSGSSVDGSPNTSNPRQPYRPSGKLLVADVPCTNRPAAAETAEGVFEKTPDHDGRDHNSGNTSPKRGSWSRPTVAPRYQTRDCGVDGSKMSRSPDDSPGCVRSNHSTGTPGAPGAAGAAEEVGGAEVQLPQGVPHDRGSATSADGGKGKDGSRLTEGAVPAAAMTAMGLDAGSVAARRHDNTDHEPPAPRAQASPVSA